MKITTRRIVILVSTLFVLVAFFHLYWYRKHAIRPRTVLIPSNPVVLEVAKSNKVATPEATKVVPAVLIKQGHIKEVNNASQRVAVKDDNMGGVDPKKAASYQKPIVISIMTGHYLGDYGYRTSDAKKCFLEGIQLDCSLEGGERVATADATWHHIPHVGSAGGITPKKHPKQLRVGMSMESSAYYGQLDNKEYMKNYDIVMSYKLNSDVVTHYFYNPPLLVPPRVPTAKKKNSVAYVNRNCGARNGRNEIVADLKKHYPVEAYGCLGSNQRVDKIKVFSESKFCIAMENSNAEYYVSEKLWHALESGCLPIYMGAPNIIQDYIPDPKAIILYEPGVMTGKSLAEKLKKLELNDDLYEEHMAWRKKSLSELSPGFQRLMELTKLPGPECQLCQVVAKKRFAME